MGWGKFLFNGLPHEKMREFFEGVSSGEGEMRCGFLFSEESGEFERGTKFVEPKGILVRTSLKTNSPNHHVDCEGLEQGKDVELARQVIGVAYLATTANFEVFLNPRQSCHVTGKLSFSLFFDLLLYD
ncbi:hypothetical protein COLO4_03311 [Corchorus olitorius]|uniref:Uncharacterized protein n=1 Tax=Corchorus olitorius TaxID=93759 RepID=A0A1R3KZ51_9ROSI|nr:hypothetical protein COLO4_03311 [Corchorus olitorius]